MYIAPPTGLRTVAAPFQTGIRPLTVNRSNAFMASPIHRLSTIDNRLSVPFRSSTIDNRLSVPRSLPTAPRPGILGRMFPSIFRARPAPPSLAAQYAPTANNQYPHRHHYHPAPPVQSSDDNYQPLPPPPPPSNITAPYYGGYDNDDNNDTSSSVQSASIISAPPIPGSLAASLQDPNFIPPTIRSDSTGEVVSLWQEILSTAYPHLSFPANGAAAAIFDGPTVAATKQFQTDHGLKVDGIVGKRSWTTGLSIIRAANNSDIAGDEFGAIRPPPPPPRQSSGYRPAPLIIHPIAPPPPPRGFFGKLVNPRVQPQRWRAANGQWFARHWDERRRRWLEPRPYTAPQYQPVSDADVDNLIPTVNSAGQVEYQSPSAPATSDESSATTTDNSDSDSSSQQPIANSQSESWLGRTYDTVKNFFDPSDTVSDANVSAGLSGSASVEGDFGDEFGPSFAPEDDMGDDVTMPPLVIHGGMDAKGRALTGRTPNEHFDFGCDDDDGYMDEMVSRFG